MLLRAIITNNSKYCELPFNRLAVCLSIHQGKDAAVILTLWSKFTLKNWRSHFYNFYSIKPHIFLLHVAFMGD